MTSIKWRFKVYYNFKILFRYACHSKFFASIFISQSTGAE